MATRALAVLLVGAALGVFGLRTTGSGLQDEGFPENLRAAARSLEPVAPVEPIGAIVEAFRTHEIVAISDAHGNERNHAFRLTLVVSNHLKPRKSEHYRTAVERSP